MEGVRGVLYREDKEVSDFWASRAEADSRTGILKLTGQVRVVARDGGSRLECETLEWRGSEKIVVARGGVRVTHRDWSMGPAPELWASPELKRVGTPDAFSKEKH